MIYDLINRITKRDVIFQREDGENALKPPMVINESLPVVVTVRSAMRVSAVWSAVNFLSRSLASLPINVFDEDAKGARTVVKNSHLQKILRSRPNPNITSMRWRKRMWDSVFTHGRAYTYIHRNPMNNQVHSLWPLDYNRVSLEVMGGRLQYRYDNSTHDKHKLPGPSLVTYGEDEIIDLRFMEGDDLISHYSPILTNSLSIAVGIAAAEYSARSFQNGGVPPLALIGPYSTPEGIDLTATSLSAAVLKAAREGSQILPIPDEHKLETIASTPHDLQSIETQRWIVEQVSRIYSLPPTLLQDLSNTSFSTSEDMDLQFTRHTLRPWVVMFDQELDLKLIQKNDRYIEHSIDGLLRGDFKSRMEGNAKAIQTGQLTPNEARMKDNRPPLPGGDDLMIQSGTVPIKLAKEMLEKGNKVTDGNDTISDKSDDGENDGDNNGDDDTAED